MKRIAHLIVHRPKILLFFLLLLTGFFAYYARQIRTDSSVESMLPQGDPEKLYYDDVRRLFGSDDVAVIGLIADDIYTPQVLQKVQRLTDEFRKIPEVKSVLSLTNASDILAKVTGAEQDLLVPDIPSTPEAWEDLKQKLANNPIYLKNLVSLDGKATAITLSFLESINEDEFVRRGVDEKIQAIVDGEQRPEQIYYTGLPHFKAYSAKTMTQDLRNMLPVTLLLVMGVLFLCFRSVRGVLLPTVTVITSLIWILGIMVLFGSSLSLGSVMLPVLVLVIGTAYSLHVMAEYYELARPGRPVDEVVLETLGGVAAPVLIAASMTFLGFFSQIVTQIVSVREMGIYSSVGIILSAVLSLTLVPALLALLPMPARQGEDFSPGLSAALRKLVQGEIRHRYAVLIGAFVLALLSAWPIPSIQVGSNFLSVFRENHPIRQAADIVGRHLAGTLVFYVVVDGSTPDLMKQWDTLRRIKDLQLYLDSLPGVDKTISFVDVVETVDNALQSLPPEEGVDAPPPPEKKTTFWDNPAQLPDALQMIFLSPTTFSGFVNHPNYSRSNILVRTSLSRPSEIAALVAQIQAFAKEHFPPAELNAHPTGNLILYTRTTGGLISGEVQSLALTGGVIFVVMVAMFLSIRVGIIGMIPNLYPILVLFGLMGATGVILSITTSIIASIALGLAVDDTIHIMHKLSTEVRTTADQEEALLDCLGTVGKPTFYVSLLFFFGFLTLCFSTFVPVQEFGFLSAVTILVGLASEVVLLPALLATTPIISLWNVLYLRLGEDPHKTIPLFAGLRPFQAKIVTLMGELKAFPRGEHIIRQGEMGNEMYVVITGAADIVLNTNGQPRHLAKIKRGDVVGEMGLIRHHERMADVVATEDVEVLAVNERFLTRIKRRYPRIASEIFFNISKILSDRLEQVQRVR
jgi:hydrophobe/amphiphile efflux-3 (HAE3) family protein